MGQKLFTKDTRNRKCESSTILYLLVAAGKLSGGQDVRDGAEAMEQHGSELNDQDEGKEEHKHKTDGFQLQMLLADEDLEEIRAHKVREIHSKSLSTTLPITMSEKFDDNSFLVFLNSM